MQKKSIIKQNILIYLDSIGVSPYKFYQDTGITRGILTQDNGMSEDNTSKFLAYYQDVNPEWLLTGKGGMLKSESIIKADPKPEAAHKAIPLVPVNAVAGFGNGDFTVMEYDIIQYYNVPDFKNADFLIPVTGSSMQPKYYGGDMLACRMIHSMSYFEYGFPHVITIKDRGTVVKRVFQGSEKNTLELRSDNPDYPPYEIPMEDIVNISIVIGVIHLE